MSVKIQIDHDEWYPVQEMVVIKDGDEPRFSFLPVIEISQEQHDTIKSAFDNFDKAQEMLLKLNNDAKAAEKP